MFWDDLLMELEEVDESDASEVVYGSPREEESPDLKLDLLIANPELPVGQTAYSFPKLNISARPSYTLPLSLANYYR